ncbi:MAG: CPBP family intramembrane metalloprotease [Deltaproteobacteria bacterium]|nr:CPBP family intramembrane metalloprotease [Deltaproteobacteria bacterium]
MAARQPLGPLGAAGPSPREAIGVLAGLVLLEVLAVALSSPWVGPSTADTVAFTGVLRLVDLVLCAAYWYGRGWSLSDLGLRGPRTWRGLSIGVLWALACGGAVGLVEVTLRLSAGVSFLRMLSASVPSRGHLALLLGVGGLVAPMFEEIVFRGILYGGLRKRLGTVTSTLAVSLLFATAHAMTTRIPIIQAAGGVLFCAAYEVSGSLWAPLLLHAAGNAVLFSLPLALSLFGR